MHYVYFIGTIYPKVFRDKGPVKIGVSRNPMKRLEALGTNHFAELRLYGYIECKTLGVAQRIEKGLHRAFKQFRIRGEWFEYQAYKRARAGKIDEPVVWLKIRENEPQVIWHQHSKM